MSILEELLEEVDLYFKITNQYYKQIKKELSPKYPGYKEKLEEIRKCENIQKKIKEIITKVYKDSLKPKKTDVEIRILKQKPIELKNDNLKKIIKSRIKDITKLYNREITKKKFLDDNFNLGDMNKKGKNVRKKVNELLDKLLKFRDEQEKNKIVNIVFNTQIKKVINNKIKRLAKKLAKIQIKYIQFLKENMEMIDKYYEKQLGGSLDKSCETKILNKELLPRLTNILDEYVNDLIDEEELIKQKNKKLMEIDIEKITDKILKEIKDLSNTYVKMQMEIKSLLDLKIKLKKKFKTFKNKI